MVRVISYLQEAKVPTTSHKNTRSTQNKQKFLRSLPPNSQIGTQQPAIFTSSPLLLPWQMCSRSPCSWQPTGSETNNVNNSVCFSHACHTGKTGNAGSDGGGGVGLVRGLGFGRRR